MAEPTESASGENGNRSAALDNVRIVLYEPQDPINIGATVRAMKNMGARNLWLVRPCDYEPNRLEQIAHDTRDVVSAIRHASTLDEALDGCTMVVAFAGKRRAARWRTSTPREIAPELLQRAGESPVALLFGREDHGLPNEALDRADVIVHVPTTEYASLNLAQAVLLALYELHLISSSSRSIAPPRKEAPPASHSEREALFQDAEATLNAIEFFKTRNPELVLRTLRSLVYRAQTDSREAGLVRAMAIEVRRSINRARELRPARATPRGGLGTGDAEELRWQERARAVIPGGTSTGSKRPEALFATGSEPGPTHYRVARGCRVVTAGGTELVDLTMALGAVALGYADPEVTRAVAAAAQAGNVSGLSSMLEVELAEQLRDVVPCAEQTRFLKSGAEGVAAAVRIARTATGRSHVIASGYFGWLDWSSTSKGVPEGVKAGMTSVPFNDIAALKLAAAKAGRELAAIVIEPVVEREPDEEWLRAVREICDAAGAVLIFDEIKTGLRLARGGWQEKSGVLPDIAVFAKALANGFPLAAVSGSRAVMDAAQHTWISSTLAGETTALAAASAVLAMHERTDVCGTLQQTGAELRHAVTDALRQEGVESVGVNGLDAMWFLSFSSPADELAFLRTARASGVLFKRGAYCFASLAHDSGAVAAVTRAARAGARALLNDERDNG
ncbi:MAG TPA: TrmJ/YjtD family RNA methyltransferase [Gemmatimonadales bacterium]|nr:TrmJ/YjtD family RNA methyltransferase [Gemmatimonadales bacterium]